MTKGYHRLLCSLMLVAISHSCHATTLVYALKVRRAFTMGTQTLDSRALKERFGLNPDKKSLSIISALPIFYLRHRHIVKTDVNAYEKSEIGGSLFNFRYKPNSSWWFELTTGIEKESEHLHGSSSIRRSRIGFDDLVFSAGKNTFINPDTQWVLYGIGGVPTSRKVTTCDLFDTLVGTRFYSLGAGTELSYMFINTLPKALMGLVQARFLHFFDRKWQPVLPAGGQIKPGNATDILVTGQYRHGLNVFEVGYNPTIFTNAGVVQACCTVPAPTFIRETVYANYAHICKDLRIFKKPVVFGAGLSGGIGGLATHTCAKLKTSVFTCWCSATIVF